MKKKQHIGALLLVALLMTTIFTSDNLKARASQAEISTETEGAGESEGSKDSKTSSEDKVDTSDLEDQRQDALDKIKDIKSDLKGVTDKIKELEGSKANLKTYIAKLDKEANELEKKIADLNTQLDEKKAEIERTKEELAEAEAVAEKQYEDMKTRIQYLYENGTPSYLELFLTAESMGDFLNKSSFAAEMSLYDRNMLDEYIAQKERIAETKAALEEEEAELEVLSEAAKEQKASVDAVIKAKNQEIRRYQSEIDSNSVDASQFKKDLAEQEKLLDQIERQIAAAAAANGSNDDGDGGGASGFIWPCPSSRRITSGFGPRPQPTPGASTYHQGIDIGASQGSSIVASASGRVTTATYSSSAGNYIVISHGNGMSTVYMHCSALYVSVGDMVSQGQKIAAVGSTGYSTGPHLHFGVIKNGSYVNPRNYV